MVDIPNVPGVPQLIDYAAAAIDAVLTHDIVVGYSGVAPKWGIYFQGEPIIVADSVVAFDFRIDRAIANYPVERGGFESYNKVAVPFLAKVQFSAGHDEANRADLFGSVAVAMDLEVGGKPAKFDVVTPEIIYQKVSISHYDYARKASSGLGLVMIDVWVQEVREQNTGSSNSASPSGASESNGGNLHTEGSYDGQLGGIT